MEIFQFSNYKDYLKQRIAQSNERGYQTRLAEAAGCKRAFLSQVIHTHIHFTSDHAAGVCLFWQLSELETDFYLTLLEHARAGTPKLRSHLKKRLERMKESRENLKTRFQRPEIGNLFHQSLYYSSWLWGAIHMALMIPKLQSESALANYFKVDLKQVKEILLGLESMNLIEQKTNGKWQTTENFIHLPKESPLNLQNHMLWRNKSINHMSQEGRDASGLNYSAIHSMGIDDYHKIKDILLRVIDKSQAIVKDSPCEQLVCSIIDFFPLSENSNLT